jgi:mannitol/fructose-specific phosphotransferase system IIA component (Ntr-type)
MIPIARFLDPRRAVDLKATNKRDALVEICRVLEGCAHVADPAAFERAVLEREDAMSTGIGLGIAVPHAKIPSVKEFVVSLGRSKAGIEFHSLDGKPVHLVVLIAGPEGRQGPYLQLLAGVTLRLKREEVRRALLAAPTPKDMIPILSAL